MVLDPSISDSIIDVDKWLKLQNATNSYYTYTDYEWLTFITINGWNYNGEPIPKGFPTLLTGDFYKNEGDNYDDLWVEEGVSVNQVAMLIKNEIIESQNVNAENKNVYRKLLLNIEDLTESLVDENKNPFTRESDREGFSKYQKLLKELKISWKKILDDLR